MERPVIQRSTAAADLSAREKGSGKIMPNYIEFEADGGTVLVEVEEEEVEPEAGVNKAGLLDEVRRAGARIFKAEANLSEAVRSGVIRNALPFVQLARDLGTETEAVEMEVSFGLVMTGEVGNVAVGKASAQSNYTVTLRWKAIGDSQR